MNVPDKEFAFYVKESRSFSDLSRKCGISKCHNDYLKHRIIELELDISHFKRYNGLSTVNTVPRISDNDFRYYVLESKTFAELASKCGIYGSQNEYLKGRINKLGLDISHFTRSNIIPDDIFISYVKTSNSFKELAKKVYKSPKARYYNSLKKRISKLKCDISHFENEKLKTNFRKVVSESFSWIELMTRWYGQIVDCKHLVNLVKKYRCSIPHFFLTKHFKELLNDLKNSKTWEELYSRYPNLKIDVVCTFLYTHTDTTHLIFNEQFIQIVKESKSLDEIKTKLGTPNTLSIVKKIQELNINILHLDTENYVKSVPEYEYSDSEFIQMVRESNSWIDLHLKYYGCISGSGEIVKERVKYLGLPVSHFKENQIKCEKCKKIIEKKCYCEECLEIIARN